MCSLAAWFRCCAWSYIPAFIYDIALIRRTSLVSPRSLPSSSLAKSGKPSTSWASHQSADWFDQYCAGYGMPSTTIIFSYTCLRAEVCLSRRSRLAAYRRCAYVTDHAVQLYTTRQHQYSTTFFGITVLYLTYADVVARLIGSKHGLLIVR